MAEKDGEETTVDKIAAGNDDVSDSALAAAYSNIEAAEKKESAQAETPVDEPKVEEPKAEIASAPTSDEPPPPVTEQEKTWHGRFMKSQETIAALQAEFDALKARMAPPPEPEPEPEPEYETPQQYNKRMRQAGSDYEKTYLAELAKASKGMDESAFAEVYDEMLANFNIKRGDADDPKTWNPQLDVELNWAKARASVYEKKAKTVKPAVKGEAVDVPVGLTATHRQEPPKKEMPQLDPEAMAVLKGSGLTDDEIREALTAQQNYFVHQRQTI